MKKRRFSLYHFFLDRRLRVATATIVAVLFCFGLSAARAESLDAEALWQRAAAAFAIGDFQGALEAYEALAESGASSIELWYNLGTTYAHLGRPYRAIWLLRRALFYDPVHSSASKNLDRVLLEIGESDSRRSAALAQARERLGASLAGGLGLGPRLWLALAMSALALGAIFSAIARRRLQPALRAAGVWLGLAGVLLAAPFAFWAYKGPGLQPATLLRAASVYSGPDAVKFSLLRELAPGARVEVRSEEPLNSFVEIELPDGGPGFVDVESIGLHAANQGWRRSH